MRHIILLFAIATMVSCGQNDTKQKELELKERELALKEKEFEMKQKDSVSTKIPKVETVKTPTSLTTNLNPDIKLIASPPQENKLAKETIFQDLYPNDSKYDNEKQLIRKINKNGENFNYRANIQKIYYYESESQLKAIAILFSYDYTSGEKMSCHACYPEMAVAYFTLNNGQWSKTKFVENWEHATGSWGEGPELSIKKRNNQYCLVLKLSYGNHGEFEDYIDYYNIETLKKVK